MVLGYPKAIRCFGPCHLLGLTQHEYIRYEDGRVSAAFSCDRPMQRRTPDAQAPDFKLTSRVMADLELECMRRGRTFAMRMSKSRGALVDIATTIRIFTQPANV